MFSGSRPFSNLPEDSVRIPSAREVVRTEEPMAIINDFGLACTLTDNGELIIKLASAEDKKSVMTRIAEKYDIDKVEVF